MRIAVVGGGISGLVAALEVQQQLPEAELHLYEASPRLGGALNTLHAGDFLIEQGADSFITKTPAALDLCRELGLEDRLIPTNEQHRRALIVHRGQLVPVPAGFVLMRANNLESIKQTPILSDQGRQRLLEEELVPRHPDADDPDHDESVASFARRRLGQEAYERLVQPLMAGIYVADAQKLSLRATMPDFLEAERVHGSLAASVKVEAAANSDEKQASGARYRAFLTLPGGMSELIDALQAALPADGIHLGSGVIGIEQSDQGRWKLIVDRAEDTANFDGIVLTTPAQVSAELLRPTDAKLGESLAEIESASSVVISCAYPLERIKRELDGFGFVVPQIEGRQILAGSFSSVKFPGRAPEDAALIRVFLGGALQSELVELDDAKLTKIVQDELAELLGVEGEPLYVDLARWNAAMPQYHVGHLDRVARIEELTDQHAGLALAGNAYRGVGIPHCIESGRSAARRVVASLV
ncbi:Protoporphyrinogen oxidase [Adhaeretor mobilis]|uniref:Coproporphyrinogen III oxidase n=1 Tax=Adhaeretor mobilis TaxID=1930276 RepID=A0A517MU23_9BACT|nr:Protoporphyrinogen oxidase [Adhaeretor mobilis]